MIEKVEKKKPAPTKSVRIFASDAKTMKIIAAREETTIGHIAHNALDCYTHEKPLLQKFLSERRKSK